jgi:hypothetical protein
VTGNNTNNQKYSTMKESIDYKFNGKVSGGIIVFQDGRYIAVIRTKSKTFRSLNGADRFMSKSGYTKVI